MKIFKFKALLALLVFGLFVFSACNETTTDPVTTDTPLAATNLQATSLNKDSIKIKWTATASESNALFAGYVLTYVGDDGGNAQTVTLTKEKNPYTIGGLTEGVIYTITIKAKYTNNETSEGITIKWSPASRFVNDGFGEPIQVYEYDSDYGSGLQIYNPDPNTLGPQVRKSTSKEFWDLGLETRSGKIEFGSATQIGFGTGTPSVTEISDPIPATGLNDLYDSKALNLNTTFTEKVIDLTGQTTGFIIVARSKQQSASWNYAKIYVEKAVSGFLQGTAKNRYIKCYISYQMKAGVPYARIK